MSRVVLKIDDLVHRYGKEKTLNRVNMELKEGNIACLLGASGCGKTTLLRTIAGFEPIDEGCITINQKIVSSPKKFLPPEKRNIGVVFQDYALFPHLTVEENIKFGVRDGDREEVNEKVHNLITSVDLLPYVDKYPSELSGGQQQRVALARALAPEPELLLLDEPFSNLDSRLRERMKHELKTLLEYFGVTALMVTHNQDEAFDIADEIGVMANGEILQWGNSYDLYHKPKSKEVASFLGISSFLLAEASKDGCVHTELGEVVCKEDLKSLSGQAITVLLRPDDVIHDDNVEPIAKVERVSFRGMYVVYHLSLPSGQVIHCFTSSHHETHHVGDMIGVRLDMKHAVILKENQAKVERVEEGKRN